jgi:hypothetical protein
MLSRLVDPGSAADLERRDPRDVIPAARNWVRNLAVATVLVATLRRLDPRNPDVSQIAIL